MNGIIVCVRKTVPRLLSILKMRWCLCVWQLWHIAKHNCTTLSCWRILQITFDFPRPDYWTMASFLNHKWQQLYQKSFANFQLLPQIPQICIPKLSAKITSKVCQPKIFSPKFSLKKDNTAEPSFLSYQSNDKYFAYLNNVFSVRSSGLRQNVLIFFFFKNWLGYIASNCRKRLPVLKRHKSMCPNCFSKLWGKQWNFGAAQIGG